MSWLRGCSLLALLTSIGCGTGDIGSPPKDPDQDPDAEPAFDIEKLTPEETRAYLEKLAPPLVGRVLSSSEAAQIEASGGAAIEPIIASWSSDPGLVLSARALMEEKLSVSGESESIDYSLPGNLVEHVVAADLPWSEILTSTSCFDGTGESIPCDSGAPYAAGVLTTRGYLASRASRFNLTRSSTLMRAFACQVYPQEESLQPKIAPERLKHLFAITDLSEASAEDLSAAVNTGCACHDCHGQFAAHSQLFVKFDEDGIYHADATGEQDPDGELGRSFDGLMTSHFEDPAEASSELSQMFGEPVSDLAQAARVLAEDPIFIQCSAQNILEYALRVDTAGPLGKAVDAEMLARIAEAADAAAQSGGPTFAGIVEATFTDPDVVRTVVSTLAGDSHEEP